jgi:hypothetical protein
MAEHYEPGTVGVHGGGKQTAYMLYAVKRAGDVQNINDYDV